MLLARSRFAHASFRDGSRSYASWARPRGRRHDRARQAADDALRPFALPHRRGCNDSLLLRCVGVRCGRGLRLDRSEPQVDDTRPSARSGGRVRTFARAVCAVVDGSRRGTVARRRIRRFGVGSSEVAVCACAERAFPPTCAPRRPRCCGLILHLPRSADSLAAVAPYLGRRRCGTSCEAARRRVRRRSPARG